MNQIELTKTFMMISNSKKPFDCDVFYKLIWNVFKMVEPVLLVDQISVIGN